MTISFTKAAKLYLGSIRIESLISLDLPSNTSTSVGLKYLDLP
ncbi:hypothetical protein QF042_000642 [Pedobacter sp. W3I1]|nr:hypothetical protein [Pedobacter sp. W3I1]